jgi:hypothetical protein
MNAKIGRSFIRMERETAAILETLSGWREGQLCFCPTPTSWSALMVLEHLARVESCALAAMRQSVRQGLPAPAMSKVRCPFLIAFMETPLRVQIPRGIPRGVLPAGGKDLAAIQSEWWQTRIAMRSFLSKLSDAELCFGLFWHPVSGTTDALQAIRFLAVHIRHHGFQLNRIRAHGGWANA